MCKLHTSNMTKVAMLLSVVSLNQWLSLVQFSASRRGHTDTCKKSPKGLNQKGAYYVFVAYEILIFNLII